MKVLLFCLLLSSVHALSLYQKFLKQHTFNYNSPVNCTRHMNRVLRELNRNCKPYNTIILGDPQNKTRVRDVRAICTTGGTPVSGNLQQSNAAFRLVECALRQGRRPPHCRYTEKMKRKRITVGCNQRNQPVHFQPYQNPDESSFRSGLALV